MLFSLSATKEGLLISLENDEGTERGEQNSSSGQLTQHLQNFFFLFFCQENKTLEEKRSDTSLGASVYSLIKQTRKDLLQTER